MKTLGVCFKPYYKWIIFNIRINDAREFGIMFVLNLIING